MKSPKKTTDYVQKEAPMPFLEPSLMVYSNVASGQTTYYADAIEHFMKVFAVTKEKVAALLHISTPTLYRWLNQNKALDRQAALTIVTLTELFQYGESVFGDQRNFFKWLNLPNPAFGGIEPQTLLELPDGISKVRDLLGRIEYGVYS